MGRPCHADRRIIPRNQTLIGIDQRIGEQGDLPDMCQDPCHKLIRHLTQTKTVIVIYEQIFSMGISQRHVDVHAGAVHACLRLRHEGCVKTMALCDGLYSHLEGHNVVCRSQSLRVLQIDFMLGRR